MSAGKSFKFVTLSTLIHSSCVLALLTSPLTVPELIPLPLGTGGDVSLEMTNEPALGEQTEIAAPKTEELPAPKVATAAKVAKSKPQIATELPPKEIIAEDTEETPLMPAVALVPAAERAQQLEELDSEISSEDLKSAAVDEPVAVEDNDEASQSTETAAATLEEEFDGEELEAAAQESLAQENDETLNADATATEADIASHSPTDGTSAEAGASEAFGTSQGVRSYENLSQIPGNKPPAYPSQARMQRQQGQVVLQYFVTANGQVSNMKLVKSSGFVVLDQEAINAISQYKYQPGQEGWTLHPITFSLNGPEERAGGRLRTSMR